MARSRNIKPGFFRSEHLVALPYQTRLLYIGLWTVADREGRMVDSPFKIKLDVFPVDNVDVNAALNELATAVDEEGTPLIYRYVVDGKRFIYIPKFLAHQNPHKDEKESVIPAWSKHHASPVQAPCNNGSSTEVVGLDSLIPSISDSLIPGFTDSLIDKPNGLASASGKENVPVSEKEIDAELSAWLVWWNSLRLEQLVACGVDEKEPSKGVLIGWKRVKKSPALKEMLSDRDAIEREIRVSTFCREYWFRLERLFGGTNRDGEYIIRKLLDGGYRNKTTPPPPKPQPMKVGDQLRQRMAKP